MKENSVSTKKIQWRKLLPVFLSFVVKGFEDIIGVATEYIKHDFEVPILWLSFFR